MNVRSRANVRFRAEAEVWQTQGTLTGISGLALALSPTFRSIGMEVQFVETGVTLPIDVSYAEFRPVGGARRVTLPLQPCRPSSGAKALYGSCLNLAPHTDYQVRVHVVDANGLEATVYGTTTTDNESRVPAASALTPTHFVRADGSDSNTGLSNNAGGAWLTIAKAVLSAASGAVVQVGTGTADEYYVGQETAWEATGRTTPITFVAAFPALDDAWAPINVGKRSIIVGSLNAGPTGSGFAVAAPWTSVGLTGPVDGLTHTVWKWTGATANTIYSLGYGATRLDVPRRLAFWKADALQLATPAGWAELVQTNNTYRYGYYKSGSDIYAILPDGVNPNTLWWTGGTGAGFASSAADCRVSGFVIRAFHRGIQHGPASTRMIADHNDLQCTNYGFDGWGTAPSTYPTDILVERNYCRNTTIWSDDQVNFPSVPWCFIKTRIKLFDGSLYATTKIGAVLEGDGIRSGYARRMTVRHNKIQGHQNGISGYTEGGFDRYCTADRDVHQNYILHCGDDAFEPENQVVNWRIWSNRIEYSNVFLSTGEANYGPVFVWKNTAWRIGLAGMAPDLEGAKTDVGAIVFKYSRSSSPQARVYVVNNTFWTDDDDNDVGVSGGGNYAGGSSIAEAFWLRNNIFRTTRNGWEWLSGTTGNYVEDYNQFVTADLTRGMKLLTTNTTYLTFAGYRTASGQGAQSNPGFDLHDAAGLDAQFTSVATGDLSLIPTSTLRIKGTPVANISDRAELDYLGALPNLGATP